MEEKMTKIMRSSIFIFLKYFHYFTTTPVLLLLPFSASVLIISQALFYSNSSPFPNTHAAGFPAFSKFVLLFLNKSFYQTFFSSILMIPFSLSLFLIAKASIIRVLKTHHEPSLPPFSSCFSIYKRLLLTHLCNMVFSIAANMVAIFILFIASGFLHGILQLLTRIVIYAFVTHTIVLCNLALVVSGMENCTGYRAIYKAFLLRRGTNSMALFLAIPTYFALASIEALFCYRVIKDYGHRVGRTSFGVALESMLISYLYSVVIVIDTIASWVLLKSCTSNSFTDETNGLCDRIKVAKGEDSCPSSANLRILIFP